ncbi:recombination factor protein RarA [Aliidiomarina shirensis]|uniref:Replication-associated recombination protein A n=1 Tax=Aliidiomarina shirensis TaxID=1048642 RepID=A0A432WYG5_9GAMM|nr:replication-associated recombination protein A [Aliidiomarina shirensis]RUO38834.1 recombination factor protein RarA [Aliidiomarina shirensis]
MPLAARMRPRTLSEYVGQQHILASGKPLRKSLEQGHLHSMILWGPPGTGKTTLAELMAEVADAHVTRISAVTSGVKDIREAIDAAKKRQSDGMFQQKTLLFVDEVHRFNKSQQDAFLPHIEDGTIIFVGATTENPGFALNNALLSRARTYRLQVLSEHDLGLVLDQALEDDTRGLGKRHLTLSSDAREYLFRVASGDARRLLNSIEIAADFVADGETISAALLADAVGEKGVLFDNKGDLYYDLLSAFHKSVRGSSPDGALYWYCRILAGGGDALIVARRLLAIASEDIGNADPRALQLALNAWDTYHRVGPAEGERAIAQATIYCASAAKSNAVYSAFNEMLALANDGESYPVPEHLRNAPTKIHKQEGYGAEYQYAHNHPQAYVAGESYLPPELANKVYYQPSDRGLELKIKEKLDRLQQLDSQSSWQRWQDFKP